MEEEFDNNLYFMMLNETGSGDDPIIEDDSSTALNVIAGIALAIGASAILYLAICSKRTRPRPVVNNVSAYDMRPPIGMEATNYGARPSIVVEAPSEQTTVVALADVNNRTDNPFTTRV